MMMMTLYSDTKRPLPISVSLSDIKPWAKWAGGKRQLLDVIDERLPEYIENYFEPFLGGGALFYHLAARERFRKAYLSDMIGELVDAYHCVKNQPERLMESLSSDMFVNSKENYLHVRSLDPLGLDPLTRGARMIFLNKLGFNGLYRLNRKGKFNVGYCKNTKRETFRRENILGASWALQMATIVRTDFEPAVREAARYDDFVFFDPPHWGRYSIYTGVPFEWGDHVRLLNTCSKLDADGVKWIVSNADHPDIWELYDGFIIERVGVNHVINSDGDGRTGKTELLIRNYEVEKC